MLLPKVIYENHKKALVLGTGGGNDIVSALIVALNLQNHGLEIGLAGMNSPAVIHTYDGVKEAPINTLGSTTKRFINNKDYKEISYVDASLPQILAKHSIKIDDIYNFSTLYGTHELTITLQKLIVDKQYDLLVAVDVGGDILARGPEDNKILSPQMDFTSLEVLKYIDIDRYLVEFGLGTDGELRPDGMNAIIHGIKEDGFLLHESEITNSTPEVQTFRTIFDDIKEIRSGNTAVNTLHTLDNMDKQDDRVAQYKWRMRIGKKEWFTPFEVTIPREYFGKVYTIHAADFAVSRDKTAFAFRNTMEQYLKLKLLQPERKSELDGFYLWSGDSRKSIEQKGLCVQCLLLSETIDLEQRKEIVDEALNRLSLGDADCIILWSKDTPINDNFIVQTYNSIGIVCRKGVHQESINSIMADIKEYSS